MANADPRPPEEDNEKSARSPTGMPSMKQVAQMALPQMGLMLCHLGISMTDLWVAGQIDAAVLASLGVVSQIFMLLMIIASVAGSGSLAAVSQALGAGLDKRARRYAGLIVMLAIGAGSAVGLAGFLSLPLVFSLLNVPEQLVPVVRVFVSVYCLNLPFYYALILMNSIFRAYTLVRLPFLTFMLVFVVNFVGSTGFGLGWWGFPAFGYAGVAWSTFGATLAGLACSIGSMRRHHILERGAFAPFRWNIRALPYLLRVGVPSAAGQLAEHGGRLLMVTFVMALPDAVDVLAGMTLGIRIQMVLLFPLGAVGLTMGIFSGRLLGAGKEGVLYAFARNAALGSFGVFIFLALILYATRHAAAGFMTTELAAAGHAAYFLSFSCIGIPLAASNATLQGLFAGTGATRLSLVAGILSMWGVQIPLVWYLANGLGWGERGVYTGILCAEFVYAIIVLYFFASRKWLQYGARKAKPVRTGDAHA